MHDSVNEEAGVDNTRGWTVHHEVNEEAVVGQYASGWTVESLVDNT